MEGEELEEEDDRPVREKIYFKNGHLSHRGIKLTERGCLLAWHEGHFWSRDCLWLSLLAIHG